MHESLNFRNPPSYNSHQRRQAQRALLRFLRNLWANPNAFAREHLAGRGATQNLEQKIAHRMGFPHCVLVNNATNGWLALVIALEERLAGKEVIVPPHSWGSTYAALEHIGCKLIFAPARRDGNVAAGQVERLIKRNTSAIVATDCRGRPHDTFALRRIADRHQLIYLSDAASSFGTNYRGRPASSRADALVISLGPLKPICLGEGGAILTRDEKTYQTIVRGTMHPSRYAREYSLLDATDRQLLNCRPYPLMALLGDMLFT